MAATAAGLSGAGLTAATNTASVSAGLKHAFQNAAMLIDTSDAIRSSNHGERRGRFRSSSSLPWATFCSNATTAPEPPEPTSLGATTARCAAGSLSTPQAPPAGTLAPPPPAASSGVPNNLLSALLNLVKRPTGNGYTYDGTCNIGTPGGSGTSATACIYGLVFQLRILRTLAHRSSAGLRHGHLLPCGFVWQHAGHASHLRRRQLERNAEQRQRHDQRPAVSVPSRNGTSTTTSRSSILKAATPSATT